MSEGVGDIGGWGVFKILNTGGGEGDGEKESKKKCEHVSACYVGSNRCKRGRWGFYGTFGMGFAGIRCSGM